ncbi:hypothetical protein GMRT_11500 [Giardia muris]|uniref:Uncharacterized protein n=1 Tax=Giardia muris TaxID=5742 RepID=A0A4Z1T6W3_GIAMU|nr:hypothetical protein GMRT_11500 [Giardia muris]|eukprot:TNJ29803.1 hypothetical protein GMRT_11500 [Giardia muris]
MSDKISSQQIEAKVQEICGVNPTAKLVPAATLRQWAAEILAGRHTSMTSPPIGTATEPTLEEDDLGADETEFGDVVELRGHKFVICNGLVIPKDLLESKVLPMIEEYMTQHGITLDQVFSEMMQ